MGKHKTSELSSSYIGKNECCVDHLGRYYSSVVNMCTAWRVPIDTFYYRIENGMSVKDALTHNNLITDPAIDKSVIWVFGEPFPSYKIIDNAYGYSGNASWNHKDNIEEWLLTRNRFYVDNKLFRSYMELSEEYGINETTIMQRLRMGWTLRDAVHKPLSHTGRKGKTVVDHLGNVYNNESEMLVHYKLSRSSYNYRLEHGWSLEKTLTTPMNRRFAKTPDKEISTNIKH